VTDAFDLVRTYIHLGLGATATPLPDFQWTPEYLAEYSSRASSDGDEGRLVCINPVAATWDSWERHPAGEEVVVLLAGHVTMIQELDGEPHPVELHAGQAAINPAGVWHTTDVHEPGAALFITPGRGTEHRPRT
jgi:uncharacterized cupin superfamily protein